MKKIRSNIDLFLSTKRIYRNTKANCASRVSCKTLYQIGVAKFLGVEINWKEQDVRVHIYMYIKYK